MWNGLSLYEYIRDIIETRYPLKNIEQLAEAIKNQMNQYYKTEFITIQIINDVNMDILVSDIRLCSFQVTFMDSDKNSINVAYISRII